LCEELGVNVAEKIRGLFFGANVVRINAALLRLVKDGRFKMSGHRNVCGEVIVDVGVQVSCIDMGRAKAGDCLMWWVSQFESDCVGTRLSKT